MTAANGMARAAAQNDTTPWWWSAGDTNASASHDDSAKTTRPTASETVPEIQTDLRTSARIRPCSLRPARIATSRTFATSIPNRVAVDAMNANCVVSVTTPKRAGPSVRVITICVTNVASTPTPRPITFCPAPPRMSRWSANSRRGSTESRAARNPRPSFAPSASGASDSTSASASSS